MRRALRRIPLGLRPFRARASGGGISGTMKLGGGPRERGGPGGRGSRRV